MIKNALKNLSVLTAGCLAALLLLEVLLRLHNPFGFRVKGDKIILFPYKHYVIENVKYKKMESRIVRSNNSLGFRGAEPPADFADSLTIIVLGSSTTESSYISDGKSWPERLSARLSRSFSKVWVNNAAMDGQSTFGNKVLLSDYIVRLRPKVAIFLTGGTDMGMEASTPGDNLLTENNDRPLAARLFVSAASNSEVFSIIQNIYLYSRAIKAGLGHGELEIKSMKPLDVARERAAELVRGHIPYASGYAARLEELVALSRMAGIEPVLVTQPTLCGKGKDPSTGADLRTLPTNDEYLNCGIRWEALELYNDAMRAAAARLRVPLVDLAWELPKDSKYFYDFFHLTAEGADKVAAIVGRDICPWLAGKYPAYAASGCPAK